MAHEQVTPINKEQEQALVLDSLRLVIGDEQKYTACRNEFSGDVTTLLDNENHKVVPVETATGMPLPVISDVSGHYPGRRYDRHHGFYYARNYKNGTFGQRAVRYSRLQTVRIVDHRDYHLLYQGGTALPDTEEAEFNLAVLGFAAYVPRFGVDLKKNSIIELRTQQIKALSRPGIFTIDTVRSAERTIGQFLMHYSLSQSFDHAKMNRIEEFLSLTEAKVGKNEKLRQRKEYLAMHLTNVAIGMAVDPLNKTYKEARRASLLGKQADKTPPPTSAWKAVKRFVGGHESEYFEVLEDRLSRQYVGRAA